MAVDVKLRCANLEVVQWIWISILLAGCACDMNVEEEEMDKRKTGWAIVSAAADEAFKPAPNTPEDEILIDDEGNKYREASYEEIFDLLRPRGRGFVRSLAMWVVDAEVGNGGFSQLHLNGMQGPLREAISGYERLGESQMVKILRSSAKLCAGEAELSGGDVIGICPDGFAPLTDSVRELNEMYYSEKKRLPRRGVADATSYLDGVVNFYYEEFPEDFGEPPRQ